MTIGKKIRQLRTNKGVTQEKLADYLNISFQAVSKWEQENTSPDIQLLPKISTYFGVTIDELFTLNTEAHLERIENMLMYERTLDPHEITYITNYLNGIVHHKDQEGKAYGLFAALHNHIAKSNHEKASEYAKKALEINPNSKDNHVMLVEANRGKFMDWNYDNHTNIIEFYLDFCAKHPSNKRALMFLLDHLIDDGRIEEAIEANLKLKQIDNDFRILWYKGQIERKSGSHQEALNTFKDMVNSDPSNWLVWALRADEHARMSLYDLAIADNKKAFSLQPKPRYIDAHECMALIYEIKGEYEVSIEMWQEAIKVLKNEWSITFGEMFDRPNREIERLRSFL